MRDVGSLPPAPGEVIAEKYRVERVVGSGGMGIVVAARHLQLGQTVAIKLLRLSGLDPERQHEARARFLREGQAAAALTSDHVVRIHDVGTLDSGEPFMVMELLRGDDLSQIIERQGAAPVGAAVDFILQACHAVAEAHEHGIVHRDLKPSNLFVSVRSDGRAIVKVLDFGISKAATGDDGFDGNLTDTRSVVGSPYYMSPEQVRDAKRVDARTDIWSLGMILYELFAGEPAFHASTLPAICAAIAADTPKSLRDGRPDLPIELDAIVQKCLSKDPDKRFQSVLELMAALTPFAPVGDAARSVTYASKSEVMALSEPFGRKVASDAATLYPLTVPSAPLSLPGEDVKASRASGAALPEELSATSGSGERPRSEFRATATLVSSSSKLEPGEAAAAPEERKSAPPGSAAPRRRSAMVGLGVAIGVVMVAVWAGHSRAPSPPPVPPAVVAVQHTLRLESQPAGARILEGDRVLGTTPLAFPLDAPSAGALPRRFILALDGYEPYSVEQPAVDHDVQVVASLKPSMPARTEPVTPAPSADTPPASAGAAAPKANAPRAHAPRPAAPPATAKPTAPSDIRLER